MKEDSRVDKRPWIETPDGRDHQQKKDLSDLCFRVSKEDLNKRQEASRQCECRCKECGGKK